MMVATRDIPIEVEEKVFIEGLPKNHPVSIDREWVIKHKVLGILPTHLYVYFALMIEFGESFYEQEIDIPSFCARWSFERDHPIMDKVVKFALSDEEMILSIIRLQKKSLVENKIEQLTLDLGLI